MQEMEKIDWKTTRKLEKSKDNEIPKNKFLSSRFSEVGTRMRFLNRWEWKKMFLENQQSDCDR